MTATALERPLERLSAGAPLPILMYHAVPASRHEVQTQIDIPEPMFRRHVSALTSAGWAIASLGAALEMRRSTPLTKVVALTIDDAYTNSEVAANIVGEFGGSCTLYVPTGFLAAEGNVVSRYLTAGGVRRLHDDGVEIGSHTHSHRPLDTARSAAVRDELLASKAFLEDLIGAEVSTVSYPHGYWSRRVARIAHEVGYHSACSVGRFVAEPHHHLLALPRLQPLFDMTDDDVVRLVTDGAPGVGPRAKRVAAPAWRAARFGAGKLGKTWT